MSRLEDLRRQPSAGSLVLQKVGTNPFEKYEKLKLKARRNATNEIHAVVRKGTDGHKLTMKSIRIGSTVSGAETLESMKQLRNEIDKVRKMDHPNIVKVYETYEYAKSIYMIMEYTRGGYLSVSKKLDEDHAARITGQLLSAVRYMHDRQIIHADLSPENVVYQDSTRQNIKIVDFSFARYEGEETTRGSTNKTKHKLGLFSPPELLCLNLITPKADLWSIGIIAHGLITGTLPFQTVQEYHHLMETDWNLTVSGTEWDGISDEAKTFLQELLHVNTVKRVDSHDAQRHPWMKNCYRKLVDKDIDREQLKKVAKHLKLHAKDSLFKNASLTVIAHIASNPRITELVRAFGYFDKHKSGVISFNEFKRVMSKLSLGDDQILQMFIGMDISGNTAVHYSEFLGATLEYILNYEIPEVQVQEAFDRMDTTKTGFIDEDDLQQLFDMTREHAEKVMDAFGEQVVGYESFYRMLCPRGCERNNTVSKKRTGMMTKQRSEPSRSFTKISEEGDRPQMDRLQSFQQPSPHHKD